MSVKDTILNVCHNSKDALVKASPDILVVAGVVGFVGATVLACRATLKANAIIEQAKESLEKIEEAKDLSTEEEYSEEDVKRDTALVYVKAAGGFIRLYGPALLLMLASGGMIFKSHGIIKNRLQTTAAALALTEQLFEQYRKNVIEKYGEEEDKNLYYNFKSKMIEVPNDDDDTKKVAEVSTSEMADISPLSVFYGPDYNRFVNPNNNLAAATIQSTEKEVKRQVMKRWGKVYIRDILQMLGYDDDYVNDNPLYALYGYEYGDYDKVHFDIFWNATPGNQNFIMGRTDTCLINFAGAHRLIDFV